MTQGSHSRPYTLPEKLTSSASHRRCTIGQRGKVIVRQPCFAQAVKQMLGILGALEESQSPLGAVNRVLRIDPQDLGRLRASLIVSPQLREVGGQPDVALPHVWGPRS